MEVESVKNYSSLGHQDLFASIGKGYLRAITTILLILRGRREDLEQRLMEKTRMGAMDGRDGVGAPLEIVGRESSDRSCTGGGVECKRQSQH